MVKEGRVKVVPLFILLPCLFFTNSLYAEENAATMYQQASSLFPDVSPFPHDEINKVIKDGWKEGNEGLKAILAQNKEAIEGFKKATEITYCDFTFGKPPVKDLIAMGPSHLKELRIAKLMMLEAKLYEEEHKPDLALENYLALTRYVRHLEQQKAFILLTKATVWVTETPLYSAIDRYLEQNENVNIEDFQSILSMLLSLKSDKLRITLENAFEEERTAHRNTIIRLLDSPEFLSLIMGGGRKPEGNAATSQKGEESLKDEPPIKLIKKVRQGIYKEYTKSESECYSYLIVAFRENNYNAFNEKCEQSGGLKFTPFTWFVFTQPYLLKNKLFQWMFSSTIAKTISRLFVQMPMPGYNRQIVYYYNSVSRLNLLIAAVAVRCYEIEKGKMLENLQELVPAYLEKIPEDPFDNFKPLKYVKKENGWIVYSFGPDKQDDFAGVEIDEEAHGLSKAKGDIVFQSF